jgi:pimeloyl-ACP methyl ester carboxylesterase
MEITFDGLVGTLTLPGEGVGPFPVVLLLTGSGPVDRDSNHKKLRLDITAQLAAVLAQHGYASFRYDKRGTGDSPGDWRASGLWDNVDDAATALGLLRGRPEVDVSRIFVAGHSEGAVQAVALAARDRSLAGIVLLAASARPGRDVLRWQAEAILPTLPRPVRFLLRLLRIDLAAKVSRNHAKLEETRSDVTRLGLVRINAKWFREFLAYDPADDLAKVDVPVLALTGAKDLQVDPNDLAVVAERAGGPVETHLLPDLTHTLRRQPGEPSLSRYRQEVRRPVDPDLTGIVMDWLGRVDAL